MGLDTYPGWSECLGFDSLHRTSNRYPSSARDGGRTTTCSRRVWRCRPVAWLRTRPRRRPSGLVPGGVGGRLYRWVGCYADVMRCVLLDLAVATCWLGQTREFLQESGSLPPSMTFTVGTDSGAMRPGVDSDVTPSSRRLFLQSRRSA